MGLIDIFRWMGFCQEVEPISNPTCNDCEYYRAWQSSCYITFTDNLDKSAHCEFYKKRIDK